jgi:uncharacterized protein (TIGR03435 family)
MNVPPMIASGILLTLLAGQVSTVQPVAPTGQSTRDARFEIASVKPNRSGDPNGSLRQQPGGRVNAINMPLRALISFAYRVQPFMLAGPPDWTASERFDIAGRLDREVAAGLEGLDALRVAMRALLEDRFKLKARREVRSADIYALVIARPDGKLGPQLRSSTQQCDQVGRSGGPPSPAPSTTLFCGMQGTAGHIRSNGLQLSALAAALMSQVERVVVDQTGLSGGWDLELQFAAPAPANSTTGVTERPATSPDAPSIYTAVQEQLGLKLEPAKGQVEMLVIESVDRPTAD